MDTNHVMNAVQAGEPASWVEKIQAVGIEFGVRALGALIVLILGIWVAKLIKRSVVKLMEKRQVDPTLIAFTGSLLYVALQIFVIVAALEKLNVRTTSLVAILGAAGLAIGLALQGSLSNFASGVLMIIFKPFKVADFVEAGGTTGAVVEISIFTTILNTPDNKKVIIPNSNVMSGNITNFSANGTRRVDLVAGIGYDDDIDVARDVINGILAADKRVLKDPAPTVAVVEMADSSVNLVVRPWVNSADYWEVYFETTEAIKKKFDEQGITIPFPQRDVHLYEHKSD